MRQIRTVPIKSDYKHKIHNHIIKAGYLARFFIIRQIKLKYVPHFHLFFIYIFVIINVVFVHKSKTWKIRFLCRCTKYQQNAKLTSNQTSHFRSFCVIYIGRFLAVLINIQVIRHKSKANSHQYNARNNLTGKRDYYYYYPPTSTYTAAVKEPYREYLLCMAHFLSVF